MANLINIKLTKRNLGPKTFVVMVYGEGLYFFATEQAFRQTKHSNLKKIAKFTYTLTPKQEDELTLQGFCNEIY